MRKPVEHYVELAKKVNAEQTPESRAKHQEWLRSLRPLPPLPVRAGEVMAVFVKTKNRTTEPEAQR